MDNRLYKIVILAVVLALFAGGVVYKATRPKDTPAQDASREDKGTPRDVVAARRLPTVLYFGRYM